MELHLIGKPDAPALMLLGSSPALEPLKKSCLLLLPSFTEEATEDEKLAALEKELLLHYGGRIRGVYAFGSAAGLALRLYASGRVRMRAVVVENAVSLPDGLTRMSGPVWYWYRKKDKNAKRIRETLKALARPLNTLCMKKLPAGAALADVRPDLAVGRLSALFGGGVSVTSAGMVSGSPEKVWEYLTLRPVGPETALLTRMSPVLCEDGEHVRLVEGSSKKLAFWSHLVRLEKADDDLTYVTDQVELDAGKLNGLAAPLTGLYLREERLRRTLAMKNTGHAV